MESKGKLVPKNERILRAAEAVFSKKGYRQATLDEIVKIADTGKGTVYKYFNNKENLFYTLIHMKMKCFLMPFVTVCMSILRLKTAFVIIFGP